MAHRIEEALTTWKFIIIGCLCYLAAIALAEIGHRLWEEPMHRWILARTVGYKKRRDQLDIPPSQG